MMKKEFADFMQTLGVDGISEILEKASKATNCSDLPVQVYEMKVHMQFTIELLRRYHEWNEE